jgi:hypothetical protein
MCSRWASHVGDRSEHATQAQRPLMSVAKDCLRLVSSSCSARLAEVAAAAGGGNSTGPTPITGNVTITGVGGITNPHQRNGL